MTKAQAKKIVDYLSSDDIADIDIDYFNYQDIETFDDLVEYLENNDYLNVEIIYYSNAIKYLAENDASLQESLGLAYDMGYSPDNLNSEILASILATEQTRTALYEAESELSDILDN